MDLKIFILLLPNFIYEHSSSKFLDFKKHNSPNPHKIEETKTLNVAIGIKKMLLPIFGSSQNTKASIAPFIKTDVKKTLVISLVSIITIQKKPTEHKTTKNP
ncbi:MAG: hypothetical protein ACKOAD_06990, partial [Gammaproteobacteria bacterium]